jgi:hypothetical protein
LSLFQRENLFFIFIYSVSIIWYLDDDLQQRFDDHVGEKNWNFWLWLVCSFDQSWSIIGPTSEENNISKLVSLSLFSKMHSNFIWFNQTCLCFFNNKDTFTCLPLLSCYRYRCFLFWFNHFFTKSHFSSFSLFFLLWFVRRK